MMIRLLAALWIGGAAALTYFAFILPTQWVRVARVRADVGIGRRVVQVSDLHVEKLRVSETRLRRLIERERPDYIFLTGDYTERRRHIPKVDRYLGELQKIGVPLYAVFGNHDYRLGEHVEELLDVFRRRGVPVLRNSSLEVDGFTLTGVDDRATGLARPEAAFAGIDKTRKTIVLAHDPNTTLDIRHAYDYLMSGHFHGGQFRVPFVFRVRDKGPLPRRGIVKGLHRDANGRFYISQGIGQANLNARFLIRSELTVHDL